MTGKSKVFAAKASAEPLDKASTASIIGIEEAIRAASLSLFVELGFHGASMRDIARRAGTSVSHLYYYYPSKTDVLRSMMMAIFDDLLKELEEALAQAGGDSTARLTAIVQAQVLFHTQRQSEAFFAGSELRSLAPAHRPEIMARYNRVSAIFSETVSEGMRAGAFHCSYSVETTSAIVTMCNGVSGWYQKGRSLSPQTLARRYAELALRLVEAKESAN